VLVAVADGQACDQQCRQAQRAVLARLYDALGGPQWRRSAGWPAAPDHCTWAGVACCGAAAAGAVPSACGPEGAVAALELPLNGLVGELPADAFAGLEPALETLNLFGNQIAGPLPPSLAALRKLRRLLVNGNALTGPLPAALGALPLLEEFDFSGNLLTGALGAVGRGEERGGGERGWRSPAVQHCRGRACVWRAARLHARARGRPNAAARRAHGPRQRGMAASRQHGAVAVKAEP
jgi:hypothetical protein